MDANSLTADFQRNETSLPQYCFSHHQIGPPLCNWAKLSKQSDLGSWMVWAWCHPGRWVPPAASGASTQKCEAVKERPGKAWGGMVGMEPGDTGTGTSWPSSLLCKGSQGSGPPQGAQRDKPAPTPTPCTCSHTRLVCPWSLDPEPVKGRELI